MTENKTIDIQKVKEQYNSWFSEVIDHLRVDQLLMEEGVASAEKKKMYDTLIFGKETEIIAQSRLNSSMYFIEKLVHEYVEELFKSPAKPAKLSMDLSDAKVLVWAEINDDDETAEDALILAEAKINAKYSVYGFHVTSTIVEKSDNLNVPPHYQPVLA
jgi:hypothetical protein